MIKSMITGVAIAGTQLAESISHPEKMEPHTQEPTVVENIKLQGVVSVYGIIKMDTPNFPLKDFTQLVTML